VTRIFGSLGKIGRLAIGAGVVGTMAACSALLGLSDPTLDNSIGSDGGGSSDAIGSNDGGGGDGGGDAAIPCGAACQPILVVEDLKLAPRFMVEDTSTLYFSNARSDLLISSLAKIAKSSVDGSAPAQLLGAFGDPDGGNIKVTFPYQVSVGASNDVYVALTAEEYTGNTYLGGIADCPTSGCPADIANNLSVPLLDSYAVLNSDGFLAYGYEDLLDAGLGSAQYEVHGGLIVSGVTSTSLLTLTSPANFIADDSSIMLYVATDDGIFTVDKTGVAGPQLASVEADQMAIYNGNLYFTSAPAGLPPTVQVVPTKGGTAPTIFASGSFLHVPAGIAVDTNYVYIADEGDLNVSTDGHIYRCPLSGCGEDGGTATVLSTGASSGNNPRTIVAGDKDFIYWGNRYGQIWKLAK
jgi:hypothetical protein